MRRSNALSHAFTFPAPTIILAVLFTAVIMFVTSDSVQAATVIKVNTDDAEVDAGTVLRPVTVAVGEFPVGSTVSDVTIAIDFTHIDEGGAGVCGPPPVNGGTSAEFNNEIQFRLTSPAGTTIDLITAGTYDVVGYGGLVTVTLSDTAAALPAGVPATGTFLPATPFDTFFGESPFGDWVVEVTDTIGLDPLCFYEYRLTIDTIVPVVSPALPPAPVVNAQPAIEVPHLGMIQISGLQAQPLHMSPGGQEIRLEDASMLMLPHDFDGNGFDTYVVTQIEILEGADGPEVWLGIWVGSRIWGWVPYADVTPLNDLGLPEDLR